MSPEEGLFNYLAINYNLHVVISYARSCKLRSLFIRKAQLPFLFPSYFFLSLSQELLDKSIAKLINVNIWLIYINNPSSKVTFVVRY